MHFSNRVGAVLTAMAVVAWMASDSFAQKGKGGGGSRGGGSMGRGSSGGGRSFGGGGSSRSFGGGGSSRSFGGGGSSRSFGGGSSSRSFGGGSSSRSFGGGSSSRSFGGGSSSRSFGSGSSGSPSFGGGFRSGSGSSGGSSRSFGGGNSSRSFGSGSSSPSFGGGFGSGGNSGRVSPSFRIGGDSSRSSSGRSGSSITGRSFPRSGSSSSSLGGFSRSDFSSNRGRLLNPSHRIGGNSRDNLPRIFSSPDSTRRSESSSTFARSTPRYSSGKITDGYRKPINIDRNTPYRHYDGRGHDHDHGHDHRHSGGTRFFFGFGYPLYTPFLFGNYGFYGYNPYWYGYDYGYGYGAPYYTSYANNYYAYNTLDSYETVDIEGVPAETPQDDTLAQADPTGVGYEYLAEAEAAFRAKDYRQAVRLGSHAAVELPEDAGVHGLLWLALTALGEYQSAAVEAHAVVHFGAEPKWENVRGYYAEAADFTPHLRALEAYVRANPDSPYGTFLLGYTYHVIGHQEHAKTKLEQAVKLAPGDAIARQLYKAAGGDPSTIPEPAAPPKAPPAPGTGAASGEESASAGDVSGPVLAPVP